MLRVIKIVFELVIRIFDRRTVRIHHLSPARNAWFSVMPEVVVTDSAFQHVHKIWALRTRSDKTHVATQHVPHLRQFIQSGLSKESADPRDPVVVLLRPGWARVPFGVLSHRPELVNDESPAHQPYAFLAE